MLSADPSRRPHGDFCHGLALKEEPSKAFCKRRAVSANLSGPRHLLPAPSPAAFLWAVENPRGATAAAPGRREPSTGCSPSTRSAEQGIPARLWEARTERDGELTEPKLWPQAVAWSCSSSGDAAAKGVLGRSRSSPSSGRGQEGAPGVPALVGRGCPPTPW